LLLCALRAASPALPPALPMLSFAAMLATTYAERLLGWFKYTPPGDLAIGAPHRSDAQAGMQTAGAQGSDPAKPAPPRGRGA
jgi:hypothetical protein